MTWTNGDGLLVKFGKEEGDEARGGEINNIGNHELVFEIDYRDVLSATETILGTAAVVNGGPGTRGVVLPKGARIVSLETLVKTPFTSSGTIGSSTLLIGTFTKSTRAVLDADDFTTTSFVGSLFDAAGERKLIEIGATGAGDIYGTTLASNQLICVSNSAHASHPFNGGKMVCTVRYYLP